MTEDTYSIDLHGLNMMDSKRYLDEVFEWLKHHKNIHVLEIVVGTGSRSVLGPVLPSFVVNYLREKHLTGENVNGTIKVNLTTKKHKS